MAKIEDTHQYTLLYQKGAQTMAASRQDVNVPSIVAQIRALVSSTSSLQSKWLKPYCERAKKLTEMDVRSPNFEVKATLFITLIDLAAKKASTNTETGTGTGTEIEIEPMELRKAIASMCTCVDENKISGNVNGASKSNERRSVQETYRKIFGQLVSRIMSIFKTIGAAQLVLAKTPPPNTSPLEMFPVSNTRSMKSSRAVHTSFDFLLVLAGRPSSRGVSIVSRGKKNRRKKKKSTKGGSTSSNDISNKEYNNPSAPSSPSLMGFSDSLTSTSTSPLSKSPVTLPNDFDYFGGSSMSTARMPLYPEKNKSLTLRSERSERGERSEHEKGKISDKSNSSKDIQNIERRVEMLENQLMEARALNGRLMLQSKLVEESPESAALALDARRLMAAEAKNYQLEKQRDVLLAALEGQQQVVDHSERILLELSEMAKQKLLISKKSVGREKVGQRVQNLLERLKASSRASRRARMSNLE